MIRGRSRFSVENSWSHNAENFRGHPFNVSEKLGYRKILCIIGGITIFRLDFFRLTVPKNFVEETDCVSEKFGSRKTLCLGGEYHDFLLKICCLTIPKNFVGEPFFVSQKLWYRNNLWRRQGGGGVITVFSQNFFLTVPKNFVVEPF